MKPLQGTENQTQEELKKDVIPADLHDTAGEVYDDKLYSMYTTSTTIDNQDIKVNVIASDLVRHAAGNGRKGYWVGVGINSEILTGSLIYTGWESPVDSELGDPTSPDGEQSINNETYWTFYFDVESARKHSNLGYIVVDRAGIHYHYSIDFSQVSLKESAEDLEPITWAQISVPQIKDNYLFGIDLSDANGNPLPEGLFVHYLNSAVDYLQNLLDITISETEFDAERHDYIRNDYQNWGFIQLDHNPVKEVKGIRMMYGDKPSVEIPLDWVQLDKLTGQITLFPSAGSANSLIIGQTGMLFGFQSQWDWSPMMWEVDYVAGIDEKDPSMPLEMLKEAVNKRASCGILNVWGDLIIGAGILPYKYVNIA